MIVDLAIDHEMIDGVVLIIDHGLIAKRREIVKGETMKDHHKMGMHGDGGLVRAPLA